MSKGLFVDDFTANLFHPISFNMATILRLSTAHSFTDPVLVRQDPKLLTWKLVMFRSESEAGHKLRVRPNCLRKGLHFGKMKHRVKVKRSLERLEQRRAQWFRRPVVLFEKQGRIPEIQYLIHIKQKKQLRAAQIRTVAEPSRARLNRKRLRICRLQVQTLQKLSCPMHNKSETSPISDGSGSLNLQLAPDKSSSNPFKTRRSSNDLVASSLLHLRCLTLRYVAAPKAEKY